MAKKQFVLKLVASRPTFSQDMTQEEAAFMHQHVAYWTDLTDKGFVLFFGLVMDPKGGWGLGAIEVDDELQVQAIIADDPALKAGNHYEVYPARLSVAGKVAT